jgi:hypothetical protein
MASEPHFSGLHQAIVTSMHEEANVEQAKSPYFLCFRLCGRGYYFLSKVDAKRLSPVSPYLTGTRLLESERGFTRRERNESRKLIAALRTFPGGTDVEISRRDTANLHRPVQLL